MYFLTLNPIPILPDNLSSLDALLAALDALDTVCASIDSAYRTSVVGGEYATWEETS